MPSSMFRYPSSNTASKDIPEALKSYMVGIATINQNTEISAGDHIKFNSVQVKRGNKISLDVSSSYATEPNAPSIGRIKLAANTSYKLTHNYLAIFNVTGNYSVVTTYWVNVADGTPITAVSNTVVLPRYDHNNQFAPGIVAVGETPMTIEVRIMRQTNLNAIHVNPGARIHPEFIIEEL